MSISEDPDSPLVPPGLFGAIRESIPGISDELNAYESPPDLFDAPKTPEDDDESSPPGLITDYDQNPPGLMAMMKNTEDKKEAMTSLPKLSVLNSDSTWFGDEIEEVEEEEISYDEDPPGLFRNEQQQQQQQETMEPQGLLRTASSRTLKILKRVRSNNNIKNRGESILLPATTTKAAPKESKRNDTMMPPPGSHRHPSVFSMNIIQNLDDKRSSMENKVDKVQSFMSFSCLPSLEEDTKVFKFEIEEIPSTKLQMESKDDAVEYIQKWYRASILRRSCEAYSNASRVLQRFFAQCAHHFCSQAWYKRMYSSCERGNLKSVLELLRREGRYHRLHALRVIQLLNRTLECGESLLHAAVRSNSLALVNALISYGSSIRKKNSSGETPLFLSVRIVVCVSFS